ncbi:MAG: Gfo/Idh/MocA family oxidoreductase [Candidatus Yanofskybacteria bacterium]|nr:Gfo/Idh/MocA family oxidoreductase [Candidatus Yanofskybacteria bacterium]
MIIIDTALKKLADENKPIRVGLVGSGFMGKAVGRQIIRHSPGIRLVGVANRHLEKISQLYKEAGVTEYKIVNSAKDLEEAISVGVYTGMEDAMLLCRSNQIDLIFEVTGNVEFSARVAMEAIKNGKHILTLNAELGGTLGPILKFYADKAGVIYSDSDGDQPGVTMNLYRFVKQIGLRPVVCGNIKGLQDYYRNPATQLEFAKKWGQSPEMVTSFADGTKISFEQCVVANATGMKVAKRGMHGFTLEPGTRFEESAKMFLNDELLKGPGIVDYLVGASPSPGVFVFATTDDPIEKKFLDLYKLGEGPLYSFYTPYHLCHFEAPMSIARVALFNDPTITPKSGPVVEVIALAKKDMKAGESLDRLGGYTMYGICENASTAREENLLPIGLAEGCALKRDVAKDEAIKMSDVEFPKDRLCDKLWQEQNIVFHQSN